MTKWFTADLHIGHALVAQTRGFADFYDTPEEATTAHNAALAERWDALVRPRDQVWVLGDISGGSTQGQANALMWLNSRPGEKHLIAGNHDGCSPIHRNSHKMQRVYLGAFRSVQAFARCRINGISALLSHFPYAGDHTESDRFEQYRLRDAGGWLLHGHTHSPGILSDHHPRQIHVGVDAWELSPVNADRIGQIIAARVVAEGLESQ